MTTPPSWREQPQNSRLVGFRCTHCGAVSYPRRRRICLRCRKTPAVFEEVPLTPRGRIVSYVVQHYLPARFDVPLPMAVVDLDGGGRIYGMMTDCSPGELRVGMEVELVWRRVVEDDGEELHAFKFKPVRGTENPGKG